MFRASEDTLTSTVFGYLAHLPTELFWRVVSAACYSPELDSIKEPILSMKFWPKWPPFGTNNANYVEPDVFIRTESWDIIIEAKRYDNCQQVREQWTSELQGYRNLHGHEARKVLMVAVGGLWSTSSEVIGQHYGTDVVVVKCRWQRIADQLQALIREKRSSEVLAIANDILEGLRFHGFAPVTWFEELYGFQEVQSKAIEALNGSPFHVSQQIMRFTGFHGMDITIENKAIESLIKHTTL